MPKGYLTIDDSPTPYTKNMCDYLLEKQIPAMLFIRGDMVDQYGMDDLIYAVQNGFVLGNHADSHTRFSELSYIDATAEIEQTERLIDSVYKQAGVDKTGLYFRFPHLDRGAGGYVVDYDAYDGQEKDTVTKLFADGVNIEVKKPSEAMVKHKEKLQAYLYEQGYRQPFTNVTFPWFQNSEMDRAVDCLYTFSTSDWMLLDRHRGRWKYKTINALRQKIDEDPFLNQEGSHSIILIHDKQDPEFPEIFKSLIDHFFDSGYDFLSYS